MKKNIEGLDGCLIVFKPKGPTSHDVVAKIRRVFGVKAGHAGNLDPMAQGVLLVFLENGLKLIQFIPPDALDKTYLARITLGYSTDTYDAMGLLTSEPQDSSKISHEQILTSLRRFVGKISQTPPIYSAIKIQGDRAYKLARKGVQVDIPSRQIHVTSIRLVKDYHSNQTRHLVLRIHCSRGTYIRSIAHDLGKDLGCGGHLSYLLRERVGAWSHLDAFPIWKVDGMHSFAHNKSFLPLAKILPFSKLTLVDGSEEKVKSGSAIEAKDIRCIESVQGASELNPIVQVFASSGRLIALYGSNQDLAGKPLFKLVPRRVLI